ncbi:MAG: hypothetical protein WC635_05495 [Bacteriovorax sp.]|jgi:hypothetical protein
MKLNLKDLKGFILSPGNIFWKQKSGKLILLSAKSDFLNFELVEKLFKAEYELFIENQIDLQIQADFEEYFKRHRSEMLVREKLQWRIKLLGMFAGKMSSEVFTQFDLNQLTWKTFSTVNQQKAKTFLDQDIELFNRGMSIATSYTLCAFMLGYYSDEFLSKLFTDTFLNCVDIDQATPLHSLKIQLETIRTQESWTDEDKAVLDNVFHLGMKKDFLIGERFDGSGIKNVNKREMTDLEILLVALNENYSFSENTDRNIFYDIKNSSFKCDELVLSVLKKCLAANVASREMSAVE